MVDVYVNGNLTLPGFQPLTVTDPLTLPEGTYEIEVYPAGADPAASAPAIAGSATLPANANASIVAHLTEAGAPTLSLFVNDASSLGAGHARVAVRHTAAAPAVDVYASSGSQLLGVYEDLTNPNEIGGDLPAGSYDIAIAPANTQDFVFGPAEVALPAQSSTIFYAVGSVADGSFAVIAQSIDLTN